MSVHHGVCQRTGLPAEGFAGPGLRTPPSPLPPQCKPAARPNLGQHRERSASPLPGRSRVIPGRRENPRSPSSPCPTVQPAVPAICGVRASPCATLRSASPSESHMSHQCALPEPIALGTEPLNPVREGGMLSLALSSRGGEPCSEPSADGAPLSLLSLRCETFAHRTCQGVRFPVRSLGRSDRIKKEVAVWMKRELSARKS